MNILTGNVTIKRIWQLLKKTVTSADLANYSIPIDSQTDADTKRIPLDELRVALMNSGLYDYRGDFDASVNLYPSSGGSGTGGLILKANIWIISVGGTIDGNTVIAGQTLLAKVDNPGQTSANWAISLAGGGPSEKEIINCYIVGSTPLASDWLSLTAGGAALTPAIEKTYIILTAGSYANTQYRWDGSSTYVSIGGSFDLPAAIHGATNKTTPVDADEFGIWDSVTGLLNRLSWANLKATLKAYFDTLYYDNHDFASSDETTVITPGAGKYTDHWQFNFDVTDVFVGLNVGSSSGSAIFDFNDKNGNSIFSTRPTILQGDTTSLQNATQPVLVTTHFNRGDKYSIDNDSEGVGAKGVKWHFRGIKS
jgi:hypothetical protein